MWHRHQFLKIQRAFLQFIFFFFSSSRRHTRCLSDWSSDVCSSDLVDVQRVAAELARVLRSEGVLLLTVPNPFSPVRKREALLQSILSNGRLSLMLRRIQRIDFYTTYLRLSRNRFGGEQWESVLAAAGFVAFDRRDFSKDAWREQATAPLVLLTVKRIARAQSGSGTI